ncbi:spore protease YyaC [Aquibacillus albus]|uniref:Sporulation protein YyaC n=1 Tax=Aquibacillus albus TaxID=1168171 RepID=A0ABS2N4A7_9BACI|nr:spore protease YyaC [Aquibacillus albus]MBM7572957.1 putative sporulation protein YyaC [Aquibacillus albus]
MLQHLEWEKTADPLQKIIPYNHKLAPLFIRNTLFSLIPEGTQHIFVVGIGSNLINGDSLGPFVGTLLRDLYPEHLTVLGNLEFPLDATTLVPTYSNLHFPDNSFVIAIDSVFGKQEYIESIVVSEGALHPGAAFEHNLPSIGDCSMMGVILEDNLTEKSSIVYTNLHLIYTMATNIATGISLAIRQYFSYPSDQLLLR